MTYRLADPYTQRTIAEFSAASYRTPRGAYHAAAVQATRHASGGSAVLLTGEGEAILYLPAGAKPGPALPSCEVRSVAARKPRKRRGAVEQLELPLDGSVTDVTPDVTPS